MSVPNSLTIPSLILCFNCLFNCLPSRLESKAHKAEAGSFLRSLCPWYGAELAWRAPRLRLKPVEWMKDPSSPTPSVLFRPMPCCPSPLPLHYKASQHLYFEPSCIPMPTAIFDSVILITCMIEYCFPSLITDFLEGIFSSWHTSVTYKVPHLCYWGGRRGPGMLGEAPVPTSSRYQN